MISIFCPWRKRQKNPVPRDSFSDQTARPRSLPPAFEPITYTPLDPVSEEQQMLDAIFSSTDVGTNNEDESAIAPPPDAGNALARVHSRNGMTRLGSFGGKLRTRFSREGRFPTQDPKPEESEPMRDSGYATFERRVLSDVLDSGNSSEGVYDSDAHKLLTPQITERLKTSPGNQSMMLATFDSTPSRDTQETSRRPFRLGLDGTPGGKESKEESKESKEESKESKEESKESKETNMDKLQQLQNRDDGSNQHLHGTGSAIESLVSGTSTPTHAFDSEPVTPLRTHVTRASCTNVDDGHKKTPTLTPSDPGLLDKADDDISPLALTESPESIEIHVTRPPGSILQGTSYDTSPRPDVQQAIRYVGTSVYSSPGSENLELESGSERISTVQSGMHQVNRTLTSKSVSPENVRKSRAPASQPHESPPTTQGDNTGFVRRSRFIEDLDDVFTLKCEVAPLQNDPEKENAGRRCSDGWLPDGKRVGYGYNFPVGERFPRLSCSEGSAEEKYKEAIRLQSFKKGNPVDYRLPIQDLKHISVPLDVSEKLGESDLATEVTCIHENISSLSGDGGRTSQPNKVSSAFASLAKIVRKHRRNDSNSTAVSGHSLHSRDLEPFPTIDPDPGLDIPIGFDPGRRDLDSTTYNRNPTTIRVVNALREPSNLTTESTDIHPVMYDEDTDTCSGVNEEAEDIQPEPTSAEVWSTLYDDCVQSH
ncbi:hypothetical protein FQN49_002712 [Arthroderma sp. PD_2]|nr:hypothetical protein FQN49_002712 [Arthroderma sp. PD_2]